MIERYRDLLIIYEKDNAFVVSCDSLGAIGNKEHDALIVDENTVGRITIKVAIAEALCIGAMPIIVSNTLSSEMHPTGNRILEGIKSELIENGLTNLFYTGSTEENFPTSMTGVGITIISKAKISNLKMKKIKQSMHVSLLGYPLVGSEALDFKHALQLKDYLMICKSKEIIEAIPVGSKGIDYELNVLEEISGLKINKDSPKNIDFAKSGGPSTCCIAVHEKDAISIGQYINKPINYIGRLA